MLYFPQCQHATANSYRKCRSHCRWLVLSQLILWVPQLETGVSPDLQLELLRKLYSTDLDVKCVSLQLCWDLREEMVFCVLVGGGVFFIFFGASGAMQAVIPSYVFYFCSQLNKGQLKMS